MLIKWEENWLKGVGIAIPTIAIAIAIVVQNTEYRQEIFHNEYSETWLKVAWAIYMPQSH